MKRILVAILILLNVQVYAQLPGLKKEEIKSADSLYIKNLGAIPVRHVRTTQYEYHYYLLNGDDTTTLRKTLRARVEKLVKAPKANERVSVLDESTLIGKEIIVQVIPFSPPLSRYWQVLIDDGINDIYILQGNDGNRIKMRSDISLINYFIGKGWSLEQIQDLVVADYGYATRFLGGIYQNNVTYSQNVYYLKTVYEGKRVDE